MILIDPSDLAAVLVAATAAAPPEFAGSLIRGWYALRCADCATANEALALVVQSCGRDFAADLMAAVEEVRLHDEAQAAGTNGVEYDA